MNAGWGISPLKSSGFHPEIWWISPVKSGGFHPDFTCEIQQSSPRFHLWNPPKIIKASVSAKTLQFDECKVGAMTKDFIKSTWFHMKSAWNPLDFKIMSFCVMIKYRSFIFQKTNQKSFCWNIWLVFQKSKDLYLIITQKLIIWNLVDFTWNLADFIWISWNPADFIRISWNPADFIRISCEIERPLARNCNPMF